MKFLGLNDFQFKDQHVLLRLDLNAPIKDGAVTNDERLVRSLPTINHILNNELVANYPTFQETFPLPVSLTNFFRTDVLTHRAGYLLGCHVLDARGLCNDDCDIYDERRLGHLATAHFPPNTQVDTHIFACPGY